MLSSNLPSPCLLFFSTFLVVATVAAGLPETSPPSLDKSQIGPSFRIQKGLVSPSKAKLLLRQLLYESFHSPTIPEDAIHLTGQSGATVDQLEVNVTHISSLLDPVEEQQDDPKNQSVVIRFENMEGETFINNKNLINDVIQNSVMEEDGTIHMYISPPGLSALGNHTDPDDIVVVQLDGEKEWLLCQERVTNDEILSGETSSLRNAENMFKRKLGTCATYDGLEIEQLDCERHILFPGDALFLPRRVVHSARAPLDSFSAHLTFALGNFDQMCLADADFSFTDKARHLICHQKCDRGCNTWCDESCDVWGCDSGCDGDCDWGCDCNWCNFDGDC